MPDNTNEIPRLAVRAYGRENARKRVGCELSVSVALFLISI